MGGVDEATSSMIAKIAARIRFAPAPVRWLLALIGIAAVLNLLVLGLNHYSHVPSGPASSSFSTVPEGVAAYSDLLDRAGHPVSRLTSNDALSRVTPSHTLVVLGGAFLPDDQIAALDRFVRSGGRLVVGVTGSEPWLARLLPDAPTWAPEPLGTVRVTSELPEAFGVREVVTKGAGSWTETGRALAYIGSGRRSLVAVAPLGSGSIALVSDPTFLYNDLLASADNAALGLDLVGGPGRAVAFLETIHGFGRATGYGAVPAQWKLSLLTLAAAALFFLIARARRLGPPEEQEDDSSPPRVAYVRSMGSTLAKTKDAPGALLPLAHGLRSVVASRTRLGDEATEDEFAEAGRRLGLNEAEVRVLQHGVDNEDDGVTAGRALARLRKGER